MSSPAPINQAGANPIDGWTSKASDVPVKPLPSGSRFPDEEVGDVYKEYGLENEATYPPRVEFDDVKEAALRSPESVIEWLLPHGKRVGGEWVALNPNRGDNKPGSFSVNMQ